jgi:hypothetical protein
MNIIQIPPAQRDSTCGPACEECGGLMRIIGIEPHPTRAYTDLRTFECTDCEALQTVAVRFAA